MRFTHLGYPHGGMTDYPLSGYIAIPTRRGKALGVFAGESPSAKTQAIGTKI